MLFLDRVVGVGLLEKRLSGFADRGELVQIVEYLKRENKCKNVAGFIDSHCLNWLHFCSCLDLVSKSSRKKQAIDQHGRR
jgi:hypothetical protein